jgi:hypothetical protein
MQIADETGALLSMTNDAGREAVTPLLMHGRQAALISVRPSDPQLHVDRIHTAQQLKGRP